MSSTFKDDYGDIFTAVGSAISGGISGGITVVLGGPLRLGVNLPKAIVNRLPTLIRKSHDAGGLEATVTFEVVVVVQESEPENWFGDIIDLLGDILDAVIADPTLGGAVDDCWPTMFSPAEIRFTSKMYYGGVIRFQARLLYG